jgi:hypothetical protein
MPLIDPTAKQGSFQKYYHYQPFCKDRLIALLRDKRLSFSDPHNVNDPWDCKPWFDYRPMLESPVKREELIDFLRLLATPENLANPFHAVYDHRLRTDNDALTTEVEAYSVELTKEIGKRRIYCITPFPASVLMWSHYSNNHHGICLEFDKGNPLIERARPVRYSKTYPEWTPQGIADDPLAPLLTKAMDWCYEREIRIIATSKEGPTKLDGNFVALPDGALTAIILGCESENENELIDAVNEFAPGLPIGRAVRVPNRYELNITER